MKDFRRINFGYMDAVKEGQDFPELLKNGFINNDKMIERAMDKSTFLFLGYKGSGKSSLSEHLKLMDDQSLIISQEGLKDFPFNIFFKIIPGDGEKMSKAKEAWRWLLSIKIIDKLIDDQDARPEDPDELQRFIEQFTQAGLFPLSSMSSLVKKTSSKSFKATVQNFSVIYSQTRENVDVSIAMATDYVMKQIASFKECHQHYIVIDDLDDTIMRREDQYISITALISESKSINAYLNRNNIPVKIVILCRTDIFDRLPDPNRNKIQRDYSFSFTWYREGIHTPSDSPLIQLINKRAQLVYRDVEDVLTEFFPTKYDGKTIYNVLLDFTRHTPRDFIQLMNSIQACCTGPRVTINSIKEGLKAYSTEYFLNEIKDEMAGYIPYDMIEKILGVISSLRKQEFNYKELLSKYNEVQELSGTNIKDVMNVLYDCSAIGHKYTYEKKSNRFSFKYRNRVSSFNPRDTIILHKGLWKALNVNF